MTPKSFHTLIARLGERAGMPFPIHPHMLRHACGFKLANDGVDTRTIQAHLGHKSHGALHRVGTDSVQKLIPGLTAPVASFEATVGGSGCPRLSRNLYEYSMGPLLR
jgi:Phage integrase family